MDKELKCLSLRVGITCTSLVLCCGLTAVLLYTVGYQLGTIWNNDALKTECEVLKYKIEARECSYQCNCYQSCSGSGSTRSCRNVCQTCYYTCYDGEVKYEYIDYRENTHRFWKTEYSGYRSRDSVEDNLN